MHFYYQLCRGFKKTVARPYILYISFYTANAQLTTNLIRLTEICLNYTFIYHTRETNATRSAETFSSEHLNGRITFCVVIHHIKNNKRKNSAVSRYKKACCCKLRRRKKRISVTQSNN